MARADSRRVDFGEDRLAVDSSGRHHLAIQRGYRAAIASELGVRSEISIGRDDWFWGRLPVSLLRRGAGLPGMRCFDGASNG